jgi:hypothetical protein
MADQRFRCHKCEKELVSCSSYGENMSAVWRRLNSNVGLISWNAVVIDEITPVTIVCRKCYECIGEYRKHGIEYYREHRRKGESHG